MRDFESDPFSDDLTSAGRPAIAVVAVHGVADQAPNASAKAIASLLLQHSDGANYTAAREVTLQIPTRPAVAPKLEPLLQPASGLSRVSRFFDDLFDDRSRYMRAIAERRGDPRLQQDPADRPAPDPNAAPDHQLMRDQLAGYAGSGEPYETVRLETQRIGPAGRPEIDVHVYEMYWADLSRLGTGVPRFFGELYQLVFHAANLGRQTLDYAAIEHDYRQPWRNLSNVHKWAVRLLTTVIPTLALVILAIGLAPLALTPSRSLQLPVAVGILGAVTGLALGARRYRQGPPSSLATWTLRSVAALAALTVLARLGLRRDEAYTSYLMVAEWLLLSGAGLVLLLRTFDRYRPGALKVGATLYVVGVLCMVYLGLFPPIPAAVPAGLSTASVRVTQATLWTVELLWTAGIVAWAALFVLGAAAWVLGWRAVRTSPGSETSTSDAERAAIASRAARAVRTSRLTLSLPAAAFLLLTTTLWYVVVDVTEALVRRSAAASLLDVRHCPLLVSSCNPLDTFLHDLLWHTATLGFPVAALFLAAGLSLLAWWLLPVVVTEVRLPVEKRGAFDASERMGRWLSSGVSYALAGVGPVVRIAILAFAIAYGASMLPKEVGSRPGSFGQALFAAGAVARKGVELIGSFLAAGAIGLLALRRGRFETLSRSLRPMLDVALDVDGYLREHPRPRTPRARIAERYASLLRYLCAWRNPTDAGAPYAAIILLAHSQGTVISADLLGFVQREPDEALAPIVGGPEGGAGRVTIPTYLFTMGSPLRQLYDQFFPHLYSWVTRRPEKWEHVDLVTGTGRREMPRVARFPEDQGEALSANPNPVGLRLTRWVNAYRSGDYIGRFLWRGESSPSLFDPRATSTDATNTRRELCVGAGAHTHYWDSPVVAHELDELILDGAGRGYTAAAVPGR